MANAINWFEIPVNDLDRAKDFYEKALGVSLTINEMGPLRMAWFPSEQNAPGATGTLIKAEAYTPSHSGTLVYFSVDDIDKTLEKIDSIGGKTLNPKMSIGEFGFVAHFSFTDTQIIYLSCTNSLIR